MCGRIRYTKRKIYHKLKSNKEVSDCNINENVAMLGSKNLNFLEMMEKVQPKILRLSTNLWKRLRDGYIHGMQCMAVHVAHLNNGEICFLKKIDHDGDEGDVEVLYLKASWNFGLHFEIKSYARHIYIM